MDERETRGGRAAEGAQGVHDGCAAACGGGLGAEPASRDVADASDARSGATVPGAARDCGPAVLGPDAAAAYAAAAPAPPAPPRLGEDAPCAPSGQDAPAAAPCARSFAEPACPPRRGKPVLLGALAAMALACVCVFAVLFAMPAEDAEPSAQDGPTSSARGDDEQPSAEDAAQDAAIARERMQTQLDALAVDEEGAFSGFVRAFMDAYDRGVKGSVSYTFADLGISVEEMASALSEGFSCRVVEVDIHNTTAWVRVEVSSKSLSDQVDAFAAATEESAQDADDEEAYRALLKEAYLRALDGVSPRTQTLLITVTQVGGEWLIAVETLENLLGDAWYTSD